MAYPDADTPLLLLLTLATRTMAQALQEHLVSAGFHDHRVVHHNVMAHVTYDGIRLTELADRAGMTKQAMSELVVDLERLGYLSRSVDPRDRRAKVIRFTPRGRRAVDAAMRSFEEIEADLSRRLKPMAMRNLRRSLLAIIDMPLSEAER